MRYFIQEYSRGRVFGHHVADLAEEEQEYLGRAIAAMRPLPLDDYLDGPLAIVCSAAKSSYILDEGCVYWCIEWEPGLLVLRFSDDGMAWVALRSPHPRFGGREATAEEDQEEIDEIAADLQYRLVFRPWDAQFEADRRQWEGFAPADAASVELHGRIIGLVNRLGEATVQAHRDDLGTWMDACFARLAQRSGRGIEMPGEAPP